jgi:hypothetical protein
MFFYVKNLSSSSVHEIEKPWDHGLRVPDNVVSKEDYKRWTLDPATQHMFVSAFEGLSPLIRVAKENPPVKMHGLIVDYDFRSCTTDKLRELVTKPAGEHIPNWGSVSFRKGAKLYWEFEKPVTVQSGIFMKKFAERFIKEMKLQNWLPGFDAGATANVSQYYEVGSDFVQLGATKIPHATLIYWLWESMRDAQLWHEFKRYDIPLDAVEREVHEQFPGRWKGPFQVGARGVRFWDPTADNDSGAQVRSDGMMAYSGEQAFRSWLDIFGPKFVARFAASKTQELLENTYYDGLRFYTKNESGKWVEWEKGDFSQKLRTKGFDPGKSKGATCSELDLAEIMVKEQRRVEYARKLVHFPKGVTTWRGRKFLNMGAPEPVQPAPPLGAPMSWEDGNAHFPLIKGVMDSFFTDDDGEDKYNQRIHLFAWLRQFYISGLECRPTQGQVIVIAGPPNKGKSLLSDGIIGGLMGGCEDGTDHFVENSRWTANIAESPVIYIGDGLATADNRKKDNFSNLIKKYSANGTMRLNQKFSKEGDVPWFGRIIVSCNDDSESLQILPNMDISNREKVSLFKTSDVQYPFPERHQIDKALARELPFFGRFLLDWKPPEYTQAVVKRFGTEHFHHPELFSAAQQQGLSGLLTEFLREFIELDKNSCAGKRSQWRGTSSELYNAMSMVNPQLLREFKTVRSFQTILGQVRNRGAVRMAADRKGYGAPVDWILFHDQGEEVEL